MSSTTPSTGARFFTTFDWNTDQKQAKGIQTHSRIRALFSHTINVNLTGKEADIVYINRNSFIKFLARNTNPNNIREKIKELGRLSDDQLRKIVIAFHNNLPTTNEPSIINSLLKTLVQQTKRLLPSPNETSSLTLSDFKKLASFLNKTLQPEIGNYRFKARTGATNSVTMSFRGWSIIFGPSTKQQFPKQLTYDVSYCQLIPFLKTVILSQIREEIQQPYENDINKNHAYFDQKITQLKESAPDFSKSDMDMLCCLLVDIKKELPNLPT